MRRNLVLAAAISVFTSLAVAQHAPIPATRTLPYPVEEPENWWAAVHAGTRSETGAPGPNHWTDHVAYTIEAELEPQTATVRGRIRMTYTNRSPEAIRSLWIHLRQNLHVEGARRNRSVEITGGMTVANVTIDGADVPPRPMGTRLWLRLDGDAPLAPGASTTVAMDFSFVVPRAGRAPRMGHEDHHVFFLGYWYPQFAVRDDVEGWVCEEYLGNGEFYMPYGDYDVTMRAPAGWLVRATGTLDNADEVLTQRARATLAAARHDDSVQHVITADDLAEGTATQPSLDGAPLAWKFSARNVRDCAVSVSDRYVWDATHAMVPGRDEPVAIHAVYEPGSRTWPRAAEYARHTIEFMSRELYPYPWPHMTACEGVIGGGMEYPMMTIVGDSPTPRALQGVIAHELIHMWFPMIVGSNEKRHAWMDEGTTSFFTDLVTADFWDQPDQASNSIRGYVRSVRGTTESPMMTYGDYYPTGFGFASYTKPAALLHQLRALLRTPDQDPLLAALRAYVAEWAYRHPTPYDLFRTVERFAGRDLDWYFRSWYFETWRLDHAVAAVEQLDTATRVTIDDLGRVPQPCTVHASWADGRTQVRTVPIEHWLGGHRRAVVEFDAGADEVRIDPELMTLDAQPENNRWRRGQ